MKKSNRESMPSRTQEEVLNNALRTGGFLFPETVEEVKEFERLFGTTDVILPEDLQTPTFLDKKNKQNTRVSKLNVPSSDFAMAAREGSSELPLDIQEKIMADIKKSTDVKKKRK